MNNADYWANRFKILENQQHRSDVQLVREMKKLYAWAKQSAEEKTARWLTRIAKNNELSLADARRLLDAEELEEFKWTVEDYIAHAEENAVSGQWVKQLENASARVHIRRQEALMVELTQIAERLYGQKEKALSEHLRQTYSDMFYRTAYETQKGTGVGVLIAGVDERQLDQVLKTPWATDGKVFSDRIWQEKDAMLKELNRQLTRNLATGRSPDEAIAAIAERFDVKKDKAARLVQTESAALSAKARADCFAELSVEEFKVVETLDGHTCEKCGAMDGKHFPTDKYEIGVTVPPFHPNCRGTTCPYFEELKGYGKRVARDKDGKVYTVPADMTYQEWKKMQDEQFGEGSVDKSRKKNYNQEADRKQYEKYKERLGEDAPDTFEDFQKIKYDNNAQWQDLNGFYRYVGNNKGAKKNDYECVKELHKLFPNGSFHIPPKKINTSSLSFDDAHINGEREHRVTKSEAIGYINSAKASRTVWNGEFERYYSDEGIVYVNKKMKHIRTAFQNYQYDNEAKGIMEVLKKYGI